MYTALSDIDYEWKIPEVELVKEMHSKGYSPGYIAKQVKRKPEEVCVLLIDLNRDNLGVLYGTMPFDPEINENKKRVPLTKESYIGMKYEGRKDNDLCREYGISPGTLVKWKHSWGIEVKRGGDRRGWRKPNAV